MMKTIKYKILVEVPENWIDTDAPQIIFSSAIRGEVERLIQEEIEKNILPTLKLPQVKISKEEVKDRMLQILAEKALEER